MGSDSLAVVKLAIPISVIAGSIMEQPEIIRTAAMLNASALRLFFAGFLMFKILFFIIL